MSELPAVIDTTAPSRSVPVSRGPSWTTWSLLAVIAVLVCSNLLTLMNMAAHEWAFDALSRVVARAAGTALASRMLDSSPTRQGQRTTKDMVARHEARQALLARDLDNERIEHQATRNRFKATSSKMSTVAKRVGQRLSHGVARRAGLLAGKIVPVAGGVILLADFALEVKDTCDSLVQIEEVVHMLDETVNYSSSVCGLKVPTLGELQVGAKAHWAATYQDAADKLNGLLPPSSEAGKAPAKMHDAIKRAGLCDSAWQIPGICN